MIVLTKRLEIEHQQNDSHFENYYTTVTLPIDSRIKSRMKVKLDNGELAGIVLPRGQLIRGGDYLINEDESVIIKVIAKDETVSTAYCNDILQLTKGAYHLGNRHIPLQIENNFLRYQHDHVLDEMLEQMGIAVTVEQAPFEPEAGAYQSAANGHNHHESDRVDSHFHHNH